MIAAAKGNIQMLNLMLANRTLDINKKDKFGVNAFWIASFYGKLDFMGILRDHGADVYATNQNSSNALHIAVKKKSLDVVRYLITTCAYKLDITKHNGVTALGIAAFKGYLGILQELQAMGAAIDFIHTNGITPLYLAIKANHIEVVQYLVS